MGSHSLRKPDRRSTNLATSDSRDLGRATCSLPRRVEAGSWQTCKITYTAGFAGIDDTGSLKIVMRYATDSGTPQFDDPAAPHYTTATASNGARLLLRYDVKDNVRPYGKTLYTKVAQGYLREGDTIEVVIGDRRQGSPGWRMQTFAEEQHELRVLVDRFATYCYEQVPESPKIQIVPGAPQRLRAVAPSLVATGTKIQVRYRVEDLWGNTVGRPRQITLPGQPEGTYRFPIKDPRTGLETRTNPVCVSRANRGEFHPYWCDLHGQSEETVGTNSIDSYFRFARDHAFLDACAHQGNDFQITDAFWSTIQQTTETYNDPGRFVTFPGWEWSGNTGLGGDRNVLFLDEGAPIHRSSLALVDPGQAGDPCCLTVESLFERLRASERDVMLVPHVGGRYADLDRHSPDLEPVVEVHSAWGTFEWMLEDAFRHGYRVGIVANSDGHKGRPGASHPGASTFGSYGGLTCVLAPTLDRQHLWQAYQRRRVYATTGARLLLQVTADVGDKLLMMGDVHRLAARDRPRLHVTCQGTAPIERVEIRNAMRVLKVVRSYQARELGARVKILWQGAEVRGRGRQVTWDGRLRLTGNTIVRSSTINFHNAEKTCDQVSAHELQWESVTTGGVAGVILELAQGRQGRVLVETGPKKFETELAPLSIRGKSYSAGGLDKRISIYPLPDPTQHDERHSLTFQAPLRSTDLTSGDNPLYIHVVQEDGHMAWSSPMYLEMPDP